MSHLLTEILCAKTDRSGRIEDNIKKIQTSSEDKKMEVSYLRDIHYLHISDACRSFESSHKLSNHQLKHEHAPRLDDDHVA